jgi:16S rRNA (guanine527-N7)-methyltransferase
VIEALEAAAGVLVSRESLEKLEGYVALLRSEAERQNLVSRASLEHLWDRHILDSAQLLRFAPNMAASWADIGSGAGFPGIVIACLAEGPVALIEPRRLRAEFLDKVVETLELNAIVHCARAERVEGDFDLITARAVAPLPRILGMSLHLSTRNSLWILPRGRNAQSELAEARRSWQGVFHVEPSATDPDSRIIVASKVKAKTQ